jgi:CHASE3 domain sensor protein
MRLTLRQKFLLFALGILIVVVALSYFSYKSNKKTFDSSRLIDHTELVISKTDLILSIGKDIETGSRGFIITGDSEFLEPLNTAAGNIFSSFAELRQFTSDEPQLQPKIDSLDFYIHKCLDFSQQVVQLRRKHGLAPAVAFTATKQGKQYMDKVRRICSDIKADGNRLLQERKKENESLVVQANRYSFLIILLRIFLTAIVLIATGSYLTKRREKEKLAEEIVQQKLNKQKEITEAVISAHEAERSEIGTELNENINQLLAASKLYTDMANKGDENRSSHLTTSTGYTKMAIEEIRKLYKELETPFMHERGLIDSISFIAGEAMKTSPIIIKVSAKGFNENILSQKFKLNLFRIVQAQIKNTIKYAKATTLKIHLSQTNEKLLVNITDDSVGFNTTIQTSGTGIKNIISRVELYKGEVAIKTAPGEGCSLNILFANSNVLQS